MREIEYRDALNEAFDEELARDENVVIMGEEVAQYNGAYKVTKGLWEKWGDKRVVDTPISEAGFIGMGIGASMLGIRPVMELMFWSFHSVAFDQLVNNAACVRYMSGGLINVPIVMRGPANGGTNVGATHCHTPEGLFAAFPGLKVCSPATPSDAKGLMKAAIRDNDPVLVMESEKMYGDKGMIPEGEFLVPIGKANVRRKGDDVTIVSFGKILKDVHAAADELAKEGIEAEIIDLVTIRPLDLDTIVESIKKTNRLVIVEESFPVASIATEITYRVQRHAFDHLDAPIRRLCQSDTPFAFSTSLIEEALPQVKDIVEACKDVAYVA